MNQDTHCGSCQNTKLNYVELLDKGLYKRYINTGIYNVWPTFIKTCNNSILILSMKACSSIRVLGMKDD